ncbi:MAG: hypothetical protein MJ001_02775 [Paludibacteraceae bacterium]|nr:hypothetical protein [Paludibacteraceae bacterium]
MQQIVVGSADVAFFAIRNTFHATPTPFSLRGRQRAAQLLVEIAEVDVMQEHIDVTDFICRILIRQNSALQIYDKKSILPNIPR